MTHHSTEDIVFRLEYASMSTPELSLLREAAAYITALRKELEEAKDDSIALIAEGSGEEICVIEGEMADFVHKQAVTEFLTNLFKRMIEEHESHSRPD